MERNLWENIYGVTDRKTENYVRYVTPRWQRKSAGLCGLNDAETHFHRDGDKTVGVELLPKIAPKNRCMVPWLKRPLQDWYFRRYRRRSVWNNDIDYRWSNRILNSRYLFTDSLTWTAWTVVGHWYSRRLTNSWNTAYEFREWQSFRAIWFRNTPRIKQHCGICVIQIVTVIKKKIVSGPMCHNLLEKWQRIFTNANAIFRLQLFENYKCYYQVLAKRCPINMRIFFICLRSKMMVSNLFQQHSAIRMFNSAHAYAVLYDNRAPCTTRVPAVGVKARIRANYPFQNIPNIFGQSMFGNPCVEYFMTIMVPPKYFHINIIPVIFKHVCCFTETPQGILALRVNFLKKRH